MRIISGKYKGRRLSTFDQDHIRPTTDRVKESLFNIIAAHVDGARVLDLFSGTGNLGLEALSRGARSVEMVEVSKSSILIIRKNMKLLDITEHVTVHQSDVIQFIHNYGGAPFDVIFIDPPFPSKICRTTLEHLSSSPAVVPSTIIAIEHSVHEPLGDMVLNLRRVDRRDYGDKLLTFYKKES